MVNEMNEWMNEWNNEQENEWIRVSEHAKE